MTIKLVPPAPHAFHRVISVVGTIQVTAGRPEKDAPGMVRFFDPPDPPEHVPSYQVVLTTADGEERTLADVFVSLWSSHRIPEHLPGAPGGKLVAIGTRLQVEAMCDVPWSKAVSAVVRSRHPSIAGGPCALVLQPSRSSSVRLSVGPTVLPAPAVP